MESDTADKKRRWTTKFRRWFQWRPSKDNPKTESHGQNMPETIWADDVAMRADEGTANPSPIGTEAVHDSVASRTTSKDEGKAEEGEINDHFPSTTPPSFADVGDEEEEDDNTNGRASQSPRNLWEEAWNSAEVKDRRWALLKRKGKGRVQKPAHTDSQKLVDDVIKNTEDRMSSYKTRWGYDDKHSGLGTARSILVSALNVKDIIDAVVKFDPTGYGAAAWAIMSFSLALVQHDKERMDLTFKACEYLTSLMALYSRIQDHYWNRKVENGIPVEEAMIKVYTAILVYAAEVQESIDSDKMTQVKKTILSLTGQPLLDLKMRVSEENENFEHWQHQIDRERGDEATKRLERNINKEADRIVKKIEMTTSKTLGKINEVQLQKLYEWLREKEGDSQQNTHRDLQTDIEWWKTYENNNEKRRKSINNATVESFDDGEFHSIGAGQVALEGSSKKVDDYLGYIPGEALSREGSEHEEDQNDELGNWLFNQEPYKEWKEYPQGLLWLHGNAGCGKSSLCSNIIKKLNDEFMDDDTKTKVLARWYFRFEIDHTKKMDVFLRSLIQQLASQCQGFADHDSFKRLRRLQDSGQLPEDPKDLLKHLRTFISKVDRDVFIVLDGLDQISERQRAAKMGLLDIIKQLMQEGFPNLHILLTSRDEWDIRSCLETESKDMLIEVDVTQGLAEDLDWFVEKKLKGFQIGTVPEGKILDDVRERLNSSQVSNFLWAGSVLRQVLQCHEESELSEALKGIPETIVNIYQTKLGNVPKNDTKRMRLILLWMMTQFRPLSQDELAAAVELPVATVKEICAEFVQTSKQFVSVAGRVRFLDTLHFTHFSVKEYLEAVISGKLGNKPEKIARFMPPSGEDAHLHMAKRCLAILSACSSNQKIKVAATVGSPESDSDSAASGSEGGFNATGWDPYVDTEYSAMDNISTRSRDSVDSDWPESVARKYAAEFWFRHYNAIDREKLGKNQQKELRELGDICTLFLLDNDKLRFWLKTFDPHDSNARPARPNNVKTDNKPSPVYYAVKLKLDGIPSKLITHITKADNVSYAKELDWQGKDGTILQLAAHQGDVDVVDALLKYNVDFNAKRGQHGTALYASAAEGNSPIVERLLKAGARSDGTKDGDLGSPLHVAAFRGHEEVVRLLLEHGRVHVDHSAMPFGTALQAASASGRERIMTRLLEKGADPAIVDGCLKTAVLAAVTYPGLPGHENSDRLLEILRSHGAQLFDTPRFWTIAYNRALPRYSQRRNVRESTTETYTSLLLQDYKPTAPDLEELMRPQQLICHAINQWGLPNANFDGSDSLFSDLLCRVPFQDQLDSIKQVALRPKLTMEYLRKKEFLYEALFWAGMNYVLGRLPFLIYQTMLQHEHQEYQGFSGTGSLPLRWAFRAPIRRLDYRYPDQYPSSPTEAVPRWRFQRMMQDRLWEASDRSDDISHLDRSDLIYLELTQQRQRQRRLEGLQQNRVNDYPDDRDFERDPVPRQPQTELQSGVLLTSDVLDLVKHILDYGNRCGRYQDAISNAGQKPIPEHEKYIEDLTFELFSVVIRLAHVLGSFRGDFRRLAEPVRLLTMVRLERIRQLDAMWQTVSGVGCTCNHAATENISPPNIEEISAALAQQVKQAIGDRIAVAQMDIVRDIRDHATSVIKGEVSQQIERAQEGLEGKHDNSGRDRNPTREATGSSERDWIGNFIRAPSTEEADNVVVEALIDKLSKATSIAAVDIDPGRPLHAYGVDSLLALELRNWLAKLFQSDVAIFDITGQGSFEKIAWEAASQSGLLQKENS